MIPQVDLRPPNQVMRLSRLGSFHQSRLSFMRVLLRRLTAEKWKFEKPDWNIDENGIGYAVYTVHSLSSSYSLIAFAHDLDDNMRTDRVIAEAWDCTFTLHDGIPTKDDIDRLKKNVPLQEAGRISKKELTLSRANRSNRMWSYVVNCLMSGMQPDAKKIAEVGYLMRTTAVYGSGKFGAADRIDVMQRPELRDPFQAEMLTVYLVRCFVIDLVNHTAKTLGGNKAVKLDRNLRRQIGIGNSTGLGMAPFLVHHPALLNTWILARETALARVRAVSKPTKGEKNGVKEALMRAVSNAKNWRSEHLLQKPKIEILLDGLSEALIQFDQCRNAEYPWDDLYKWSEATQTEDVQEQIVSVILEPYGSIVDNLGCCMYIDESAHMAIDATGTTAELKGIIEKNFSWALETDFEQQAANSRFWYVSESKLEPRLGERFIEVGCELEQPLSIARDVCALDCALTEDISLAEFLKQHPEHRHVVRRVQLNWKFPYSEIQDNLLAAEMLPIDMLRCKLSFFGATKFDPKSDRWVRICMYQNAPLPDELDGEDSWSYDNALAV